MNFPTPFRHSGSLNSTNELPLQFSDLQDGAAFDCSVATSDSDSWRKG
jgi:hypothetical protein